jgi:hypothetical protein
MRVFASLGRKTENAPVHFLARGRSGEVPERKNAGPISSFATPMIRFEAFCACGGGCPRCQAKSNDPIVSQPNDPAEIEADQMADRVMRKTAVAPVTVKTLSHESDKLQAKSSVCEEDEEEPVTLQRKEGNVAADPVPPDDTPPPGDGFSSVRNVINSGGHPLDPGPRSFFELRFGHDFSKVRLHTDSAAAASARLLNARAYTCGDHIVFGQGYHALHTPVAQQLLAHELTHVVQQARGLSGGYDRLEQQAERAEHDQIPIISAQGMPVSRLQLSPDRATHLIVLLIGEQGAQFTLDTDTGQPLIGTGSARGIAPGMYQVSFSRGRGQLVFRAADGSDLAMGGDFFIRFPASAPGRRMIRLLREVSEAIPMEVRRGETPAAATETGGTSGEGRATRLRQEIDALPQHVRDILFDPSADRRLSPADYETALRVGQKLAAMTATELADWRSRTTFATGDWATFEASLDAYIAAEAVRRREALELSRTAARLYRLEELYELRAQLRGTERLAWLPAVSPEGIPDPNVLRAHMELPELRTRVQEALRQNGFASMAEFEAAITAWRTGFERETVRVSDVLLDRLDHILFESERRYGNAAEAAALARAVAASGAPEHFALADTELRRSIALSAPISAMIETPIDETGAAEAAAASAEASRSGETAMRGLSAAHPLLGFTDFPRGRLGRASADEVQSILLEYIAEHRESVRSTRDAIHSDTDYIYKLDNLLAASKEVQGITPGSIYDRIIRDYIEDQGLIRLVTGIVLAVITLALTIATFGTGTLAVAAGVAAFGLSAWQAVDAFREYMRQSSAADAQLLSEDPSIAWLVIAVGGAVADLGAVAAAVRAIRPFALALNETGDVAAFRSAIEALPGLNQRILNAVEQGAEAQAAIRRQWQALAAIGHRANDIIGVVAESGYRLMVMAWHGARRGVYRFEQFLAELQQARIIAEAGSLTPAEIAALRGPYYEGVRRAREGFLNPSTLSAEVRAGLSPAAIDEAAAFGRFLGLEDDAVVEVLVIQARVAREADPGALSPGALHAAMRERAGVAPEELVPDVRGLPESGVRTVGAVEQSYEIGVAEGRRLLEGRGWGQWDQWINPFEFNGRYGQGLDDVFVDDVGRLWVVEYKGGTAELSPGQMSLDWVQRNIRRLRAAGYDHAADPLQAALDAGTLRGVVVYTAHGEAARAVEVF